MSALGALGPAADGRHGRTLRSRRAICEACLDLVQEGVLFPRADQVADRAGLSRRSVFHHFESLPSLYDAVVEAGLARCAPLLEDIPASGPATLRVTRLARVRARFLEATTPFRRSLAAQALVGAAPGQALRVARELLRRQRDEVAALFAPELAALDSEARGEWVEALAAAVSPSVWEHLRASRGLSPARARDVLERSLNALLRDAVRAASLTPPRP